VENNASPQTILLKSNNDILNTVSTFILKMERYNKIHVWIGTTFTAEKECQKYFELDYSTDICKH